MDDGRNWDDFFGIIHRVQKSTHQPKLVGAHEYINL